MSQVDPADVESFSVLKDASAAAVYVNLVIANGVILVTSKRGTVKNSNYSPCNYLFTTVEAVT